VKNITLEVEGAKAKR